MTGVSHGRRSATRTGAVSIEPSDEAARVDRMAVPGWVVRLSRVALVVLLSVGLGFGLAAVYQRVVGGGGPQVGAEAQETIRLINAARASASCPPAKADAALMALAQSDAQDMAGRGFLSAVNPENEDPVARARRFGYTGSVAESYAAGLATPQEVVQQWTNSANAPAAPVKQRLLACRMVSIGIGHDTGTALPSLAAHVWVVTLGDR
jgi:uncharacterized protein YkwD